MRGGLDREIQFVALFSGRGALPFVNAEYEKNSPTINGLSIYAKKVFGLIRSSVENRR